MREVWRHNIHTQIYINWDDSESFFKKVSSYVKWLESDDMLQIQ